MASVNKFMVVGNLGRDPEQHTFNSGKSIVKMSVATSRKNIAGQEETTWVEVKVLGKAGDFVLNYLKQGDLVCADGFAETRAWIDKNTGEPKSSLVLTTFDVTGLGSKRQGQGAPQDKGGFSSMEEPVF